MTDSKQEAEGSSEPSSVPGTGSRLIWFICLYCAGAVTVASVAYGVRFWVGS